MKKIKVVGILILGLILATGCKEDNDDCHDDSPSEKKARQGEK